MMTPRPPLILLAHRIPYPPHKGDKIRSFHLLRFLAEHYSVHVGAFVDDPADWRHAEALRAYCSGLHLQPLRPRLAKVCSLGGFATGQALTVPYYTCARLRRWVTDTARWTGAQRLLVFSSAMAQYADAVGPEARCVLDLVDVDSAKWRQYAEQRGPLTAWLYRREAQRLLQWEARATAAAAAATLVSAAEVELFERLCPQLAGRVTAVANGVDTDYFRPDPARASPYAPEVRALAFTGAMDYWPNIDAVHWFADVILPRIRAHEPRAVFHIVGARPSAAVRALARRPGVIVTGAVADMRPWLQHAELLVAPLRIARGIQNKVLEGFAMARPVLATTAALDGLDVGRDYPLCADEAERFAALAVQSLAGVSESGLLTAGALMRERVCRLYAWEARLQPLLDLLEGPDSAQSRACRPGLSLTASRTPSRQAEA